MEKKKTDLKEILSFLLILAGSAILAINMNTFVEQGGLVPGGFSGLSKLIQRVALTFFGLKIPFTLLNVFFNAIPAMLAYRFVGKKFTILSCISIVVVSVLVDQLPVTPITGEAKNGNECQCENLFHNAKRFCIMKLQNPCLKSQFL